MGGRPRRDAAPRRPFHLHPRCRPRPLCQRGGGMFGAARCVPSGGACSTTGALL
jgi:hypothetical protein